MSWWYMIFLDIFDVFVLRFPFQCLPGIYLDEEWTIFVFVFQFDIFVTWDFDSICRLALSQIIQKSLF